MWHQFLIPYLDRQRLLGQHRECCALRGKGWGKKHATVDYAFKSLYATAHLVAYHALVMDEMKRRGYHPDEAWYDCDYRGSALGTEDAWCDLDWAIELHYKASNDNTEIIYWQHHNDDYLRECINLLKEKNAPIDWEKVVEDGLDQV